MTTGAISLILPLMSNTKAEKFYQKAKSEGRTRGSTDRTPAPVEEEYRIDTLILLISLSFIFLLSSYFLLK